MSTGNNDEQKPKRGRVENLKPFEPGVSGNPAGVPKGIAEIKAMHLPYGEEALERLVDLMRNGSDKLSFYAAKEILDRILGRTRQEVSGPDGGAVKIDLDTLEVLRRLAAKNG